MTTNPIRVIFDTDIGTDVDDCIALAFLLGSPEIQIEGITCVYGDVSVRARMCRKLLNLRGRGDIPVYEGISSPLLGLQPIYWPGHEGLGLLEEGETFDQGSSQHAVDYLVEAVLSNPGQIHLLAVGPLTNIATAMIREPRFAETLSHLTIMGGLIQTGVSDWGPTEHNIKCDPEAAHIVFSSGAPISLVPLDVTLRATIDQRGIDVLRARKTPYHDAVADQIALYPPFIERGGRAFLHDPLAAATLVRPDILIWQDVSIDVELTGTFTKAMTVAHPATAERPATVRVALDLHREQCETFIVERIAN
ncbi:MAG: nucleoside hydrolase [Thermomicrobiales bacterium]